MYQSPNYKMSSIATKAKQLQDLQSGVDAGHMTAEARQASIQRISADLNRMVSSNVSRMGSDRFNFALQFGLEHGFRPGE
ncbi:MAG: hypothetical protein U1E65_01600 [Myxococcota bacterium]